jgi:hypothetical protein
MDEWNVWLLDGLAQAPAFRAAAIQSGGLSAKMDMMLCCIEIMAQDAGKREKGLRKHMTAMEQEEAEAETEEAEVSTKSESSNGRDGKGRKKKDRLKDAPDFSNWE